MREDCFCELFVALDHKLLTKTFQKRCVSSDLIESDQINYQTIPDEETIVNIFSFSNDHRIRFVVQLLEI